MKDNIKRYAKNLSTYFGASLIPMLLNLVTNPWIAKNMSPHDYAITGYYNSFSSLIGPIITFYLIHYYIKEYFRLDDDERKKLLSATYKALIWLSGIISIICFIALFIFLKYIKQDLNFPIFPYLLLMVFSLPLTGLLNFKLAQYRISKNVNSFFTLSVTSGCLTSLSNVLFVVIIKWGALGKLFAPFLCNLGIFLYLLYTYRDSFKEKIEWGYYRKIFLFCFPLSISAMSGYFTNGFTTTYLESIGQTTNYGIYVVGVSIATYLSVFSSAIGSTFQPDIYETAIKKQRRLFVKYCLLQIGLISLVVIVFIILAPYIVSLLTASRYDACVPYARIIAISSISCSCYYIINNYCLATNRPNLYLYGTILGSIFMILAVPYAVKNWEFYGGAWMTPISYIVFSLINLILMRVSKINESKD